MRLSGLILPAFIIVPLVEIFLLIKLGGVIGAGPTILLVIVTAVAGVSLLKRQGLSTLTRARGRLDQGELPARDLVEGVLLLIAGAFLLTPGLITDSVGFCLLVPPVRGRLAQWCLDRGLVVRTGGGAVRHTVIEGEYRRTEEGTEGRNGGRRDDDWS